jgi:ATP-dependent DNA helicase RecG
MPDQCSSSHSAPSLRIIYIRKLILPVAEPRYRLQAWRISLPILGKLDARRSSAARIAAWRCWPWALRAGTRASTKISERHPKLYRVAGMAETSAARAVHDGKGLDEPLRAVLGGATVKGLAKHLDLHTVGDLLGHYPRRYAQRGELTDLASLREGEDVTVLARVATVTGRKMVNRPGRVTEVTVTDGHGRLVLTFFRKNKYWESRLKPGTYGLFAGKISTFKGKRQLAHPDFEPIAAPDAGKAEEFAAELIPVYPATKDFPSWKIAQAVRVVLDTLGELDDPLPARLRERFRLIGMREALTGIHRPAESAEAARARKRLRWDEAFLLQAALAQRRRAAEALPAAPRTGRDDGLLSEFDRRLPFTLTAGQIAAGETIARDLGRAHPMHRLLQGEVGAGKTVIAVRAMLQVVDAGGQAALLAPTEVLAQQHSRSIAELLGPLGRAGQLDGAERATRIALLTGSQGAAARREALLDAASGAAGIVIGTHALLQEHVQFADLGLVVIDEQHRFGVEQRDMLREKAASTGASRPHVLVMTATPIPRTVAMTVFGDLDVSTLTELPKGRSAIATHVVPAAEKPRYLERAWERVREEVGRGRQAYVVCPRIGEEGSEEGSVTADAVRADAWRADDHGTDRRPLGGSGPSGSGVPPGGTVPPRAGRAADADADTIFDAEEYGAQPVRPPLAVLDIAPKLANGPLARLRLAVLHGGLHPDEKDRVMRAFADGNIDVLVATTVIEVGVDVRNASVMVVMDADRFGVSQLHQLRGRVGRGSEPGLCLLITDAPAGAKARERLDAVASTLDGFELSRLDLEQRREGDVLGAAQSGRRSSLKLLRLLRDEDVIRDARAEAIELIGADPELEHHPALAKALAGLVDQERAEYLEKA